MGVVCLRPCLMRTVTVLCVVGGRKRTGGRVMEVRLLSFLLGCSLGGMRDELPEVEVRSVVGKNSRKKNLVKRR